jgi:hypothetical protein
MPVSETICSSFIPRSVAEFVINQIRMRCDLGEVAGNNSPEQL